MLFCTHLQVRKLCPQTYSLSLLLEWSQVTHSPILAQNGQDLHKFEKSPFYSTFARQLHDDTYFLGWLSWFPAHSNIQAHSTLTNIQALHTQIAKHHVENLPSFFLKSSHSVKWNKLVHLIQCINIFTNYMFLSFLNNNKHSIYWQDWLVTN